MLNINNVYKPKLNQLESMSVWFYSSFVCMSAYANVFFTAICECLRQINIPISGVHCGSAVRFGQAVQTYLIPTHHLCAFLMYLARQNGKSVDNKPSFSRSFFWCHREKRRTQDEFCEERRAGAHLAEGAAKDTGYVHVVSRHRAATCCPPPPRAPNQDFGDNVSGFSYMERQANNSGPVAKRCMERQAKSRKTACLGIQDKESKSHITKKLLVGFHPNLHQQTRRDLVHLFVYEVIVIRIPP